jgi:hypothetical protein
VQTSLSVPVPWARPMRAVGHTMSGQNLAYRSTMELVGARQLPNGLTCQIGSDKPRLILLAEVYLSLPRCGRARPVSQPTCALTCDDAVETFEISPRFEIR